MTDRLAQLQAALTGHYTIERELGRGGMVTRLSVDPFWQSVRDNPKFQALLPH
jgi:hypothetical protein